MSVPVVIDAHSLVTRCIMASALDDLRAGGTFTGGVYGTLTSLVSLLTIPGLNPGAIYACFDAGIPPRRRELLPDYKANRAARRQLLSDEDKARAFVQVQLARQMFGLLGVVCLRYKEREGDDVVAAVVRLLRQQGQAAFVITGDHDLWQTVRWDARVWDLGQKRVIEADNFADAAGVPLDQYLLYRALVGDASDGIAGAGGVGPVRAAQMLQDLGDRLQGSPPEQLDVLVEALQAFPKRRKYEDAVIAAQPYLHRVLAAIDLGGSFGKTGRLREALFRAPPCDLRPFLRFCKGLQFASVMGDPQRFFRPFREAHARRHALTSQRVAR